jgi:hypothetical protein
MWEDLLGLQSEYVRADQVHPPGCPWAQAVVQTWAIEPCSVFQSVHPLTTAGGQPPWVGAIEHRDAGHRTHRDTQCIHIGDTRDVQNTDRKHTCTHNTHTHIMYATPTHN